MGTLTRNWLTQDELNLNLSAYLFLSKSTLMSSTSMSFDIKISLNSEKFVDQ